MISEVPDDYATHCDGCNRSFMSKYTPFIKLGAELIGKSEECPYCGAQVGLPDMRSNSEGSSLPVMATFRKRDGPLRPTSKLTYFCIVNSDNQIKSAIWKCWVQGSDVYICNDISKSWKLSIHKSGHDNIAIMKDIFHNFSDKPDDRTIIHRKRSRPFDAHFNGLACLNLSYDLGNSLTQNISYLKNKKLRNLIRIKASSYPLQICVVYSKQHPDRFYDTYINENIFLCILKASRDDYISIYISNDDETFIQEPVNVRYGFKKEIKENMNIYTDFGIVKQGTFFIGQYLSEAPKNPDIHYYSEPE